MATTKDGLPVFGVGDVRFTTTIVAFSIQTNTSQAVPIVLTVPQWETLLKLASGEIYVRGGEVKRAQGLVERGLAMLEDHGADGIKKNFSGERWVARLTELGKLLAARQAQLNGGKP